MSNVIGIRKEDKSEWEHRVPLIPGDVKELVESHNIRFLIQPSAHRAFGDTDFITAGAASHPSLEPCDVVIGIKEFTLNFIRLGGVYMFFSHTIKGQPHNMPLLKRLIDRNCTLIDYEMIRDGNGNRLIFFGRYAGLSGMLDTLWALGRRLEFEGSETPFSKFEQAYKYPSLNLARDAVKEIGTEIAEEGLPEEVCPLVVGFAGYGNVSKGGQEILDLLPHTVLSPEELEGAFDATHEEGGNRRIYKVVFKEEHIVEPKEPGAKFKLQDYYDHPEIYRGVFRRFVPYLTVVVNANYWDERYPRLITRRYLRTLFSGEKGARLKIIGDISCDMEGGIECTDHCTQPDMPVYVYDVESRETKAGWEGNGPVILAVDNLPAEFPREASEYFSGVIKQYVPHIAREDFNRSLDDLRLPGPVKRGIILHKGEFTPEFEYMKKFI